MIFTHLTLHNYSAFRGRHTLDLSVVDRERPVILIGALNGSGKTSLLDAFHLALYGKRARTSNRGELAYDDYLRECVHRGSESEGALLDIGFRHRRDGQDRDVRVVRQWRATERSVREEIEVFIDGRPDSSLAENWDEEIETMLPIGIAGLFLFDGEQIEKLADLAQAQSVLTTAIEGLLGLDIVSQLDADLRALPQYLVSQQRKRTPNGTLATQALWQHAREAEARVEAQTRTVEATVQATAAARNDTDQAAKRWRKADDEWNRGGGSAYANRAVLEKKRTQLQQKVDSGTVRVRELAADALPYALVRPLLRHALETSENEAIVKRQRAVLDELSTRDQKLLAFARKAGIAATELKALKSHMAEDRTTREQFAAGKVVLDLSDSGKSQVQALLGGVLDRLGDEARRLTKDLGTAQRQLDDVERELARVPSESAIAELAIAREDAMRQLASTEERLRARTIDSEAAKAELKVAQECLEQLLVQVLETDAEAAREQRLLDQAGEIRAQLVAFRQAAVAKHVARISSAVLECFQSLIRKRSLVDSIDIDPKTYAVTLRDELGHVVPPKRMSAGERQLLATSLLWGLVRVSGRALPTVIDTPLGRMDSHHRRNLIERYFPVASHQVILLSTDEEINGGWLDVLQPAIGRTYILEHDETERVSAVRQGYFGSLP